MIAVEQKVMILRLTRQVLQASLVLYIHTAYWRFHTFGFLKKHGCIGRIVGGDLIRTHVNISFAAGVSTRPSCKPLQGVNGSH